MHHQMSHTSSQPMILVEIYEALRYVEHNKPSSARHHSQHTIWSMTFLLTVVTIPLPLGS